MKISIYGLLSLFLFISCQSQVETSSPDQKPIEKIKEADANLESFDAGTIQLLEHYALEYESRDTKRKIETAYKLHKAVSAFKNPMAGIEGLKDPEKIKKIYNYHIELSESAKKFEIKLSEKQRQDIFDINKNSVLKLLKSGIISRDVSCDKYFFSSSQIQLDLFFNHRNHIFDFLNFSDLYYIHHYISKMVQILKDMKASSELIEYYLNLQGYFPKKTISEADANYEKLLETFLKITKNKIPVPSIKQLFQRSGECFWNNSRNFNIAVLGLITQTRASWVNDLINQQKVPFIDGELVSVSFKQADFPYDRPIDGWNKFFKFKLINNKQYLVSEGENSLELSDDIEIELK